MLYYHKKFGGALLNGIDTIQLLVQDDATRLSANNHLSAASSVAPNNLTTVKQFSNNGDQDGFEEKYFLFYA